MDDRGEYLLFTSREAELALNSAMYMAKSSPSIASMAQKILNSSIDYAKTHLEDVDLPEIDINRRNDMSKRIYDLISIWHVIHKATGTNYLDKIESDSAVIPVKLSENEKDWLLQITLAEAESCQQALSLNSELEWFEELEKMKLEFLTSNYVDPKTAIDLVEEFSDEESVTAFLETERADLDLKIQLAIGIIAALTIE